MTEIAVTSRAEVAAGAIARNGSEAQPVKLNRRLALLLLIFCGAGAAAPVPSADGFAALAGRWACEGYFVRSGKRISSTLTVTRDETANALIVRHDDSAPNRYHAVELWTSGEGAVDFRSAVADASGMRWFVSPGWTRDTLTWSRPDTARPAEQFVYALDSGTGSLRVNWLISRDGGAPSLGDSLSCHRQPTRRGG